MASRPTNVAVLDDDEPVRKAISRLLNASQMTAQAYSTGTDFLTSLARGHPDCLVLDLQMPGMNGLDVINYLVQRHLHVPIVMVTAHDGPGLRDQCLAAGAAAYLRKPLDAAELLQAVTDAVAGHAADRR